MANPVVHWEIGGSDRGKLKEFYSSMFDWEIHDDDKTNYSMCETGEGGIGGGLSGTTENCPEKNFVVFYVKVDDLQASLDKAVELGGKALVPPTVISEEYGSFALFQDPEGNTVGLWKGNQ